MNKCIPYFALLVAAIVLIGGLTFGGYELYKYFKFSAQSQPTFVEAPEAKKAKSVKRVTKLTKQIEVYDKKQLVVKFPELPLSFKTNENKQAVASTTVPAYEGDTDVFAIADLSSDPAKFSMLTRHKELPLVQLEGKLAVGAFFYPYRNANEGMAALEGRLRFLRVDKAHFELRGELDNRMNWKGGIGAVWEFNL